MNSWKKESQKMVEGKYDSMVEAGTVMESKSFLASTRKDINGCIDLHSKLPTVSRRTTRLRSNHIISEKTWLH